MGSAGLKNFDLHSVGPKSLSWVARMTWVEILVWVVWVRKTFGLSQKKNKKSGVSLNVLILYRTRQKTLSTIEYNLTVAIELSKLYSFSWSYLIYFVILLSK